MIRVGIKVSGLLSEVEGSQGVIRRDYALYLHTLVPSSDSHLPGNRQFPHHRDGTAHRLTKSAEHNEVNIKI